ncbi:MAG: histidine phosphatase family protein [Alphaproteobacteria bacterium]|nr:histidine phosphatase family protein [Alphaproteobacteria bacterium]
MEKHFFIFRHGQTTYNANGLVQGQTNDSVLTEHGIKQAYEIGLKLKKYPLDVLICSPLKRTLQTAKEVQKSFENLPISENADFIEVNIGEIEGLHFSKVMEQYGEKYQKWRDINDTDLDFCFNGGESKRQVRERALRAINHYVYDSPYKYIAVSTHGILLAQICNYFNFPVNEIKNGSILHLCYDGNCRKIRFI